MPSPPTSPTRAFSNEIRQALRTLDPLDSAAKVKELAAKLLESADPAVTVKFTSYFNNSYTPDLILSWPGQGRERQVFLRTTPDPHWLAQDLHLVPSQHSTVMPLEEEYEVSTDATGLLEDEVEGIAHRRGVLVAGSDSVESVSVSASEHRSVAIFSSALLRGGHGYIEQSDTGEIVETIVDGFRGARAGEQRATQDILDLADRFLALDEDRQITEVLQLLWIGGGSATSSFPPSDAGVRARLDPTSLRFLLENKSLADDDFWVQLARKVDIEAILALEELAADSGLGELMSAAAGQLHAKACTVLPPPLKPLLEPAWRLQAGILFLDKAEATYAIHTSRSRLQNISDSIRAVDLSTLLDRANTNKYEVSELALRDESRRVVMSDTGGGLGQVSPAEMFAGDPWVESLVVRTPRGRTLGVDPRKLSTYGRRSANPYLADVVETAALLLVGVDEESLVRLRQEIGAETLFTEASSGAEGDDDSGEAKQLHTQT